MRTAASTHQRWQGGNAQIRSASAQAEAEPAANPSLARGDFARLFDEATPTLRLVAAAEVGRLHADDAVQQAAVTALASLDRYEPGTDFRAWMAAITRNAARNMRRSEHARGRRERTLRLVPRRPRPVDHEHAPLFEALAALPGPQRECLLLRIVGEHTYDQIALILGIPAATARSHVFRARAQLLSRMEGGPT